MIKLSEEISIDGIKVCIALPSHSGMIPLELGLALADLTADCQKYGVILSILAERGNSLVTGARNKLLARFLKETDSEYLFWIDDDIVFKSIDFLTLLALCIKRKSVAASYCTKSDDNPVFFIHTPSGSMEFNEEGFIEADGVGLGFACQHRSILEPLLENKDTYLDKNKETVWDVFKIGAVGGKYYGEDMTFFKELYKNGHITYVHPMIHLKHVGRKDYDHRLMNQFKENTNGGTS